MSSLYLIPTPIGNVDDITLRAVEVLKKTPVILSEDTRVTKKLFDLLGIDYKDKKFITYFDHSEDKKMPEVFNLLKDGIDVALVSDAGTPILNDPGYKLVREVRKLSEEGPESSIELIVLPGATSITTALLSSGFPPDKFMYLGYIPRKVGERTKMFDAIEKSSVDLKMTFVAFETKHRIVKTLEFMDEYFSSRIKIALCQELTKKFERVTRGTPKELLEQINDKKISTKGEMVLVFTIDPVDL